MVALAKFLSLFCCLCSTRKFNEPPDKQPVCVDSKCDKTAEIFRKNMDVRVDACENFYKRTCGNYPNVVRLPSDDYNYTNFHKRIVKICNVISRYVNSDPDSNDPPYFQKIRKFYKSCADEDQIKANGYAALQSELNIIGMSVEPPFHRNATPGINYGQLLGKIHRFLIPALPFLFDVHVAPDRRNNKENILEFRSVISSKFFLEEYTEEEYIIDVIKFLYERLKVSLTAQNKKDITQRVNDVISFSKKLKEMREIVRNTESTEGYLIVHILKDKIDKELAGGQIKIDFFEYIKSLFTGYKNARQYFETPNRIVRIESIQEFTGTLEIIQSTDPSVFESAIWWRVIYMFLQQSPVTFEKYFQKRDKKEDNITPNSHRQREHWSFDCAAQVRKYFGKFVGYLLITKEPNSEERIQKANEMYNNIKKSFKESIQRTKWIDEETRKTALKKLDTLSANIGYPDSLMDPQTVQQAYEMIDIQDENYLSSLNNILRYEREKHLSKLFSQNRFEDIMNINPSDPVPIYYTANNHIEVPIGGMGFPLFDLGLEVLNYASLGTIIAHEIGHAFYGSGTQIDENKKKVTWWTTKSVESFKKIVNCFENSYDEIFIEAANSKVNGPQTVNENMADAQGYQIALKAYERYVKQHGPEPTLPGFKDYNYRKLFSFAFANFLCSSDTPTFLKNQLKYNSRAPNEARVNGVLRNSKHFSDDWGCKPGTFMNPIDKCHFWDIEK